MPSCLTFTMYSRTYWEIGTDNKECDICGFLFKRSQLKKDGEGLWVCPKDYDTDSDVTNPNITPYGGRPDFEK